MKVSLNWLQEYIKTKLTPQEISDGLTDLGLECTYERYGTSFTNIVVGKVVDCRPHKNSDYLSICTVDTGNTSQFNVVCGGSPHSIQFILPLD